MALKDQVRARLDDARRHHQAQVEDSWLPRAATAAAVGIALVAVAVAGAAPLVEVALSVVLVAVGNVVSHRRRREQNGLLKTMIAAVVVLVLLRFFVDVGSSQTIDDARLPLTSMFLAVQALHAFDLPRTRDLTFTVSASMALIALGAASSRSAVFLVLVVAWLALAGVSLWLLRLGAARRRSGGVLGRSDLVSTSTAPRTAVTSRLLPVGALSVATMLVFLALPRPEVGTTVSLPFQQFGDGIPSPGGITNPGLPVSAPDDPDSAFDPVAYFGLADTVDIRTAGQLSDQLVLRVRTSRPRLLRGLVFDHYEDNRWTRTAEEPPAVQGLPIRLRDSPGPRSPLSQTIEVVTATPNLVFSAGEPFDLYHASRSARLWDDGTVTVANTQDPGTVYSVISNVPVATEAAMRVATGPPPEDVARYLQMPDLSDRTLALAEQLLDPTASNYVNAESVMAWMRDNVAYSLDLDDHPPDADAVDTLLFERQLGWCEPISASMVMLLRAGGIPARWVTGFQPGDFDVFSGFWEVRARHAHAWVEVWIPQHGWIAFDPTGAVPNADGPATSTLTVPLVEMVRRVAAWFRGLDAATWLGLLLVVLTSLAVTRELWLRHVERTPFGSLRGVVWEPWETPTDIADRLRRDHLVPAPQLDVLVAAHHARQLSRPGPGHLEVRRAHRDVRRRLRRGSAGTRPGQ